MANQKVYLHVFWNMEAKTLDTLYAEVAANCACLQLRRAARLVTQWYDEALRPSGVRATQFTLLVAIRLMSPAPITELAKVMGMDRTTLTRNLKPLETNGWIQVQTGQDRRVRAVTLTEPGQEALDRALPLWKSVQARVVEGLGAEKWCQLAALLQETATLAV
jgi:DNA-binding MarR family transcriptional regulator